MSTWELPGSQERSWADWILPITLLLSFGAHVALFQGLSKLNLSDKPSQRVEVDIVRPPPPPPKPVVPEKPKFLPPKLVKTPPPPAANKTPPLMEKPAEPPKPVFGVTKDSTAEGDGVEVPVGNTLMKEPDAKLTRPEDVKPYVQPVKAPFVPSKLVEITDYPTDRDRVVPEYPPELRAQGVEGTVILEVDIDADGMVVDVRIKRGTGLAFDQAALKAMKASRYNPARRGSEAVPIRVTIPVKFRLR